MLPPSWRLHLDAGTRRTDAGRVLIGGSPLRLLRLNAATAKVVDRLLSGSPIGDQAGPQLVARRLLDAGIAHPRPGATDRSAQDVTVVIPIFGHAAELQTTLAALGPVAAVVVVDDASPDPAVVEVARAAGARVERLPANRGPAAARNTGWRQAATELIAFVDAGCEPEPGWLERLLPHFDDPTVVAVAPRIATTDPSALPPALAAYEAARPSLDRGPAEAIVRPRSRVPYVPTTTLVVRRSALEDAGGFDEAMRLGEDVDLVWRLVERGGTVRYDPSTTVGHPARTTAKGWLRQRYGYGTSAAPLARRHGPAVAPLVVSPWTAAAWLLLGTGARKSGVAVAVGTTVLLTPRLEGLEHPWKESLRLAGLGHLYGGRALADALRRPWWPLALAGAVASRRLRAPLLLAAVGPPLNEWRCERPRLDPLRWLGVRLLDDAAYGAGVWAGCWRDRSAAALRPDLISWPGRRAAIESLRPSSR